MRVTSSYEHALQAAYFEINNRGICMDSPALKHAKATVRAALAQNLAIASNQWNIKLYVGAKHDPNIGKKKDDPSRVEAYNLNASSGEKSFIKLLQRLGYNVPRITTRTAEGEYDSRYSANELALQRVLRNNEFNYPSGDPAIKAILNIRELSKLESSYLNAHFYKNRSGELYYLTNYNVAGTLTGRRASRIHSYGYGNNAQNLPKHSNIANLFGECLVARPGNILLSVDQKSAEEWPVSALAENYNALTEMINGVNRHIKRASFIFSIPESSRTEAQWKDSIEYYLGKKTGHANNYGMQPPRMADSLIQEGHWVSINYCAECLNRLNILEPNTRGVFHKHIEDTLLDTRTLVTPLPFQRERQFLKLRPNGDNKKVFNEAYAYIPQSTVGDNTGYAIAHLNGTKFWQYVIHENHDSIMLDLPDEDGLIIDAVHELECAFKRKIIFHNGIEVEIPIEIMLGYNFAKNIKLKTPDLQGVRNAKAALT